MPSLLAGWNLLQRSMLSPAERSTVIAAASMAIPQTRTSANTTSRMLALRLPRIEEALKTQWQDEELFARDDRKADKEERRGKKKSFKAFEAEESEATQSEEEPEAGNEAADDRSSSGDSNSEIERGEACLAEISDGEDRVELESALATMHDARNKKRIAQRSFVQARAIVRDIRKNRRFFRPRKEKAHAAMNASKRFPTPKRRSTSTPQNNKGNANTPRRRCYRCGSEDHEIKDCTKPKPTTPSGHFAIEVASMADDLERELAAAKKRTRELEKQIELRKELERVRERERELLKKLQQGSSSRRSRSRKRDRREKEPDLSKGKRSRSRERDRRRKRGDSPLEQRSRSHERGRRRKRGDSPQERRNRSLERGRSEERKQFRGRSKGMQRELQERCKQEGWVRAPTVSPISRSARPPQESDSDEEEEEEQKEVDETEDERNSQKVPASSSTEGRCKLIATPKDNPPPERRAPEPKKMPSKPWTGPIPAGSKNRPQSDAVETPRSARPVSPPGKPLPRKVSPPPRSETPKGKGKGGKSQADWALWRIEKKAQGKGKGGKGKNKDKGAKKGTDASTAPPEEEKERDKPHEPQVKKEEDPDGFESPSDDEKSGKEDPEVPTAGDVIKRFYPPEDELKLEPTATPAAENPEVKKELTPESKDENITPDTVGEKAEILATGATASENTTAAMMTEEEHHHEDADATGTLAEDMILIDTGATGDLFSSELLEKFCQPSLVQNVDPEARKKYRFANNSYEVCCSQATVQTKLGVLTLDVREATTMKPSLLGIRTIRKCQLDLKGLKIIPPKANGEAGHPVNIVELPSGHLAIRASELFAV